MRKIREAKAALEAEAGGAGEQVEAEGKDHPGVPETRRNATSPTPIPGL